MSELSTKWGCQCHWCAGLAGFFFFEGLGVSRVAVVGPSPLTKTVLNCVGMWRIYGDKLSGVFDSLFLKEIHFHHFVLRRNRQLPRLVLLFLFFDGGVDDLMLIGLLYCLHEYG